MYDLEGVGLTSGILFEYTGDLVIENQADDKDIVLKSDDGSGGVATYLTLDGSAKTLNVSVPLLVGVNDTGYDVFFYGLLFLILALYNNYILYFTHLLNKVFEFFAPSGNRNRGY